MTDELNDIMFQGFAVCAIIVVSLGLVSIRVYNWITGTQSEPWFNVVSSFAAIILIYSTSVFIKVVCERKTGIIT